MYEVRCKEDGCAKKIKFELLMNFVQLPGIHL